MGNEPFSLRSTSLPTFVKWCEGKTRCLSPVVASGLGLDAWLYSLRKKPIPTFRQEHDLKLRLLHLAQTSPLQLHESISSHELKKLLGPGFEWVETDAWW